MLQVNGIDHIYDLSALSKIINVIAAAAYNMGRSVRSKKMTPFNPLRSQVSN
jgi:hypothetical protein